MRRTIIINFITILFISCIGNKNDENLTKTFIETNLEFRNKNNPIGTTTMPFRFFDSIPKEFRGIFKKDSSFVGYINTIDSKDFGKLYDENQITENEYKNIKTKIYCLSGYNNGKQFYCIDLNGNKDFSDDKVVEFDKEIAYKTEFHTSIIDSFPSIKMKVNKIENDNIFKDEVSITFFPNANYFNYDKESESEKLKHSLQLVGRFNEYLYGTFFVNDIEYKISMNKYSWGGYDLIFSSKDIPFHNDSNSLKGIYKLKDTLKISNAYYVIDKATIYPPKIKLKSISIEQDLYGFREGYLMKDFAVENIEGTSSNLSQLFKNKQLLLLDFWGTWCGPCKELTPDLVELNMLYNDKVSIVSLAYEQDPNPVKDYVKSNNMHWFNGIIKDIPKSVNPKSKIIKNLRISSFPTFILIDTNFKIIYRGYGEDFMKLSSIIKTHI